VGVTVRLAALVGFALAVVAGCGPSAGPVPDDSPAPATTNASVAVTVAHAQRFSLEDRGPFTVVRVNAPLVSWSRPGTPDLHTDAVVLVPRATPDAAIDDDLRGLPVIRTPARTIAVNAEADEAILNALGATDRLVAVGGLSSYDDAVRARAGRGELGQIGYTWHAAPNLEVLVSRRPDVFFMRMVDLDHADALNRVRAVKVPVVPSFAWAEPTYLGAAEWVKLYGRVLGLEREADTFFQGVASRAAAIRGQAARQPRRPVVLWGYYAGGQQWQVYHRGVEAQLIRDAGGESATASLDLPWQDGGITLDTEQLLRVGREADVWIIGDTHAVGQTNGIALPQESVLNLFRSWREGRLFHNYARRKVEANAFDWYESHGLRPDLVLADLFAILHPDAAPGHALHFFGPFAKPAR